MGSSLRRLVSATLLAAVLVPSLALADDGYTAWMLAADRGSRSPDGLATVVTEDPTYARVWFYGYVFDLATPGISEAEKTRIAERGEGIAAALRTLGDTEPRLLMDFATDGRLVGLSAEVRQGIDVASAKARAGAPDSGFADGIASSTVARAVFYGLLHRSHITRNSLGGRHSFRELVGAARVLAADYAHLTGDLDLWRAIAAWDGQEIVSLDGLTIAQSQEAEGLNALLAGRPQDAQRAFAAARSTEMIRRGPTPHATLLRGGAAEALAQAGNLALARGERGAMLTELAQLGRPWLEARNRARIAELLLLEDDASGLRAELDTLEGLGDAARSDVDILAVLVRAADALRVAGAEAVASKPAEAEARLATAGRLYDALRDEGVLSVSVPSAEQEAEARVRTAAAARVQIERARLQWNRGRIEAALATALTAQPLLDARDRPAADRFIGEIQLALGQLDDALVSARAALAAVAPVDQAEARRLMGLIRLRRGDWAPAFAWANAGLRGLRDAGIAEQQLGVRVRLHRLAALALDADGHGEAAVERLRFALALETSPAVAMDLARAQAEAGDVSAARATLATVDTPAARVARGCLAARAGAWPEAARQLRAPRRPGGLPVEPGAPAAQLESAREACLALVELSRGKRSIARQLARQAAARMQPHTAPAVVWAVESVRAMTAQAPEAVEAARARAVAAWRLSQAHGNPALDRRPLGPLADPGGMVQAIAADRKARPEATRWAVWWSMVQGRAARPQPELLPIRSAMAAVIGRESAFERATAEPDVAAAREALGAAREAVSAALDAHREQHRAAAELARPAPPSAAELAPAPGAVRVYYQTGARAGRVVVMDDAGARVYPLPGLGDLLDEIESLGAAMRAPERWPTDGAGDPHEALWTRSAGLARTLVPFARALPAGARVELWADGPLRGFPFEALVLEPPTAPGISPRFLASGRDVEHLISLRSAPAPAAEGSTQALVGVDDALGQAMRATLGPLGDRLPVEPLAAALGRARLHVADGLPASELSAPVAARGLVAEGSMPPMSLLRWAGLRRVVAAWGPGPADPAATARLWSEALGRAQRPVRVWTVGADRPALVPGWWPIEGEPSDLITALHRWRATMLARPPVPGQIPDYHPARWARYLAIRP